jgi:hypothetical protein
MEILIGDAGITIPDGNAVGIASQRVNEQTRFACATI